MDTYQEAVDKLILHWGEMGAKWGINRTMAQVHALLFATEKPLSAEEIMDALQISRGNVSMSLRELMNWGIVTKMHIKGERKEFYTTEKDVWQFFKIVSQERKKREIDPTIDALRDVLAGLDGIDTPESDYTRQKVGDLLEMVEMGDKLYRMIEKMDYPRVLKLIKQFL